MKKKVSNRKANDERLLRKVSSLNQKAAKDLLPEIKTISLNESNRILNTIIVDFEEERKSRIELSKVKAEFLFKNAKQINELNFSNPKYLSNYIQSRIAESFGFFNPGDVPIPGYQLDPEEWEKIRKKIEELINRLPKEPPFGPGDFGPSEKPEITEIPAQMEVGNYYTVLGKNFGANAGKVYAKTDADSPKILFDVNWWNSEGVNFRIPYNTGGIPFDCQGTFYLCTENYQTTSHPVELIPGLKIYFGIIKRDESGANSFFQSYNQDLTINSPELPFQYVLFKPVYAPEAVLVQISDNSFGSSDATCSLLNGPSLDSSGTKMTQKVKVTDGDWYWNYTLTVKFLILVPNGFEVPTGWS